MNPVAPKASGKNRKPKKEKGKNKSKAEKSEDWKDFLFAVVASAVILTSYQFARVYLRERPYQHQFVVDSVGFREPEPVLLVNTLKRREMVLEAIGQRKVDNVSKVNPLEEKNLYLQQLDDFFLLYKANADSINRVTLVPLNKPVSDKVFPFEADTMAYFGPIALQTIIGPTMVKNLQRAKNVLYKKNAMVGGMLALNPDGTVSVYKVEQIPRNFIEILPVSEGLAYLEANADISNPDADQIIQEYLERSRKNSVFFSKANPVRSQTAISAGLSE